MGKGTPSKAGEKKSKKKDLKSPSKKLPPVTTTTPPDETKQEKKQQQRQRNVRMVNHGLHKRLSKATTSNPGMSWRAESQSIMCSNNDKVDKEVVERTIEMSGRNKTIKPRHAYCAVASLLVQQQGFEKGLEVAGPIVDDMIDVAERYNKLHGIGVK